MMSWKLYLDDIRTPKDPTYVISRTVEDAQKLVLSCGVPFFISFDHDLGIDSDGNLLPTGYDFAKCLVEMDMDGIIKIPKDFSFTVHSANPVGAKNIEEYLDQYLFVRESSKRISMAKIDSTTHERLKEINTKLMALEEKYYPIAVRLDRILQDELSRNVDGMDDYNLELEIQCYNADEEAEPLCVLREWVAGISIPEKLVFFIGDGINHNTRSHIIPMKGEHHCWLYHCLYDHTGLSWEEIASIRTFWVEIKTLRQYDLIYLKNNI